MAIEAASRYAEALFATAKASNAVDDTLQHLLVLKTLIEQQPLLRQFFLNPDVDPEDKVGMLDRVTQKTWSDLVRAFMRMIVALGRAELLAEVVIAFQALVDAQEKRIHVTVRSARKLGTDVRAHLLRILEQREGKVVELKEEQDSELIGGLQIFLDHRVIDGSIRRELHELERRLKSVSVT